ncbi:hypothetical protein NVV93_02065 [Pseudomonas sp. LS44]|uniref:hypothetical protein n=1 Tax=Pseudomonas sp. LS44 TaxID=1357074 RepID=UPI00215B3514|nr:hypothetical protein [Pseudomonas sp. LS44]UVE18211.1 hypothetical protein NVV93_02065 [Pseudomonas sp. LS44]
MPGSALDNERHSTPETPRPQMGWRFIVSLAVFGLLLGLMLGRLSGPSVTTLEKAEVQEGRLLLWFDQEPSVRGESVQGVLVLRIEASGAARHGQLQMDGKTVNWRIAKGKGEEGGLLVNLVAARPLRGEWRGAAVDGRWRLEISPREE